MINKIINMTGVTTIIKQFVPIFDTDKWSKFVAQKDGKTQNEVLLEWKIKADNSIKKGKEIHKRMENYLKSFEIEKNIIDPVLASYISGFQVVIKSEEKIYNQDNSIIGIPDLIIFNGQKVSILDWKTSEKIKTNNKYEKLLSPLQYLDNCDLNIYSLQLSFYAYLLESQGFEINKLQILHLDKNTGLREIVNTKYLKKEIELILKYAKYKKNTTQNS
jgi:ATP-dependent exoDNAse (exonuclease V) beta subunit